MKKIELARLEIKSFVTGTYITGGYVTGPPDGGGVSALCTGYRLTMCC